MPIPNGNSKGEAGVECVPEVERVLAKARRRHHMQQQKDENQSATLMGEAPDTSARSSGQKIHQEL